MTNGKTAFRLIGCLAKTISFTMATLRYHFGNSSEAKFNMCLNTDPPIYQHISLERRILTVEEYRTLRDAVGWCNGDRDAQSTGLRNSLFSVCLICDGKLIGCGRVVGDGGNYFYIQDIIVLPDHQRQGLSRLIMDAVMDYIERNAKSGAFIGLMAASGVAPFYEKYGFKIRDADRPGMGFYLDFPKE